VPLARTVVLHCDTSDQEAARRFIARERANPLARPDVLEALIERMERGTYDWQTSDPLDIGAPVLRVDTTDGAAAAVMSVSEPDRHATQE
jgi:hypothetical protein